MTIQEKQLYFNLRRNKKIRLKHIANHLNCSISLLSRYEREDINMDEYKIIGYKNFITDYWGGVKLKDILKKIQEIENQILENQKNHINIFNKIDARIDENTKLIKEVINNLR